MAIPDNITRRHVIDPMNKLGSRRDGLEPPMLPVCRVIKRMFIERAFKFSLV